MLRKITQNRYSVILILLVITFLTVIHFNDSIWTDEQRTLYYAGAAPHYGLTTFSESVARIAKNLWQAPAYYLTLWGWGRSVGWSVFAMRIPSLYFGLLAVAATYSLSRRFFSKPVAFYAAATLAFNAFYINFMHDMRAYIFFAMLTVFMFWFYVDLIKKRSRLVGYIAFTMTLILMLYTHYFAVFPIAALGLCHLIFRWRKKAFFPVIICFVIAGIAFLPWANILIGGTQSAGEVARSTNNFGLIGGISEIFYLFSNGSEAFLLLLLLFAAAAHYDKKRFVGVWMIAGYALLWGVTRIVPAFTEIKYAIFFWPALAVAAGIGVHYLQKLGINPVILLVVWVGMFIGSLTSDEQQARIHPFYTPQLDELSSAIMPHTQPDDALLFVLPSLEDFVEDAMLDYYFYDDDLTSATVIRDTFATTDNFFRMQVEDAAHDAERVWLTYESNRRNWRIGSIEDTFLPEMGFATCGTVLNQNNIFASLFARQPANITPYLFNFDATNTVDLYLLSEPLLDDDELAITIGWNMPPEIFGEPLSIALHIEDTQENIIAQADFGIIQPYFDCQFQQIEITNLSAEDYHIKATVYNWQTGERLLSTETPTDDNRQLIATLHSR